MNLLGHSTLHTAGRMATEAVASEPWRAVTALTLHVDAAHLAGNALGLGVFGLLLARRTGLGVSVAVAVAGGALGNVLDAALVAGGVVASPGPWVGASTAVFALVGALGATYRSIVMLALGACLVVACRAPGVNDGAHVAGLVAGLFVGLLVRSTDDEPAGAATQMAAAGLSCAAVAACWALAIG